MSIITTINFDLDFWELYPNLAHIEEFKYIKANYRKSSKVMWFIVGCFDLSTNNIFRDLTFEDKTYILGKDLLGDEKFYSKNDKNLDAAIQRFISFDTAAKRHLRQWVETLEKRTAFLKEAEYSFDNYEKLDKMAANTSNIFKTFNEIDKQLNKEESGSTTKGGYVPSMNDNDEI